jgi:hypothetical protein
MCVYAIKLIDPPVISLPKLKRAGSIGRTYHRAFVSVGCTGIHVGRVLA